MTDQNFWSRLASFVAGAPVVVDRPNGSARPRIPGLIYPLDYGYLENTTSSDGGGIDVWVGSLNLVMNKDGAKTLTGILCTFDTLKRDAEIKLLIGCTEKDIQDFHSEMHTLYIPNAMVPRT